MSRESHYQEKSISYGIAHTRLKRLLGLVSSISGKKVLDVGCARGYVGSRIKNMGNFVVGIDISESAASEAKKIHLLLGEKGEIIITTPNILLWTNRVKILMGKFEYTNQGLMDFGHIRFFTYKYLNKVLKESGFKIIKENHIIFPGKLTKILKNWPSIFATQFIIKAEKI